MPHGFIFMNSDVGKYIRIEVPMQILITGSRDASPAMIAYAKKVVERAKLRGYSIIVGDASGVDDAVIRHCDKLGVYVEVWGAYNKLRHKSIQGDNHYVEGSYPDRDRLMAARCDICIAIWNGVSRGTKITYEAALAYGKEAHLKTF
jgi:predicted Rossmann fold nucleotide-binding protein DprA/Smf involved in DNA uptake